MSEYISHEEQIGSLTLKIIADDDRENPRQWESAAVMVCDHGRYNLGDENGHDEARDAIRASRDYRPSWEDFDRRDSLDFSEGPDLYKAILRCSDIVTLPLYLYDHSGITMSTSRFSCAWDSGQVGFIFMTKAKALEAFMVKGTLFSAKLKERVRAYLESDVAVYDQFLTGDVWGYVIEDRDGDEIPDGALWSLFGHDYAIEEGRSAARRAIEHNPEYAEALELELE